MRGARSLAADPAPTQLKGVTVTATTGADTRRYASAWSGADAWRLESLEAGQRTWLLSLEGKW